MTQAIDRTACPSTCPPWCRADHPRDLGDLVAHESAARTLRGVSWEDGSVDVEVYLERWNRPSGELVEPEAVILGVCAAPGTAHRYEPMVVLPPQRVRHLTELLTEAADTIQGCTPERSRLDRAADLLLAEAGDASSPESHERMVQLLRLIIATPESRPSVA